jgi:hypothetical protein
MALLLGDEQVDCFGVSRIPRLGGMKAGAFFQVEAFAAFAELKLPYGVNDSGAVGGGEVRPMLPGLVRCAAAIDTKVFDPSGAGVCDGRTWLVGHASEHSEGRKKLHIFATCYESALARKWQARLFP